LARARRRTASRHLPARTTARGQGRAAPRPGHADAARWPSPAPLQHARVRRLRSTAPSADSAKLPSIYALHDAAIRTPTQYLVSTSPIAGQILFRGELAASPVSLPSDHRRRPSPPLAFPCEQVREEACVEALLPEPTAPPLPHRSAAEPSPRRRRFPSSVSDAAGLAFPLRFDINAIHNPLSCAGAHRNPPPTAVSLSAVGTPSTSAPSAAHRCQLALMRSRHQSFARWVNLALAILYGESCFDLSHYRLTTGRAMSGAPRVTWPGAVLGQTDDS
jgi:hypothetical protein